MKKGMSLDEANQTVHLDGCFGFMCLNKEQKDGQTCFDYKIRQCCPKRDHSSWTLKFLEWKYFLNKLYQIFYFKR
jgi:hypothetical protein